MVQQDAPDGRHTPQLTSSCTAAASAVCLVSTRVVSPGELSLSFAANNSAAAHAGRLPEHHVLIRQSNSSMPAVLPVVM